MRLCLLSFFLALFMVAGCGDGDNSQANQQFEKGYRKADGTYTTDPPPGSEPPVVDSERSTTRGTLKRDADGELVPQLQADHEKPY